VLRALVFSGAVDIYHSQGFQQALDNLSPILISFVTQERCQSFVNRFAVKIMQLAHHI